MQEKIFALGFFDGVHLGHQALLNTCVSLARERGALAAAITFDAHPQSLFSGEVPGLLTGACDRDRLLRRCGIACIRTLPVTPAVMSTPWQTFLEELIASGAVGFVCGRDFRFGHRGEGNAEKLLDFCRERGLLCRVEEDRTVDGIRVSSTHVRALLEAGDMAAATRFLGHPHILTGTVISGRQLGRTIGVPTANLQPERGVLYPRLGVYACLAEVDGVKYPAVTNVGMRPTVEGHHVTVEPWLLDFAGDLYGKTLTLEFYSFLRPERKFDSLEELKKEIQKNALQTREYFQNK